MRVPNTGPAELERLALIAHFEKRLAYFKSIPPRRREAESADAGEDACRMMLTELSVPGYEPPHRAGDCEVAVTPMTLDAFFAEIEIR
jgi:hypothetical protein